MSDCQRTVSPAKLYFVLFVGFVMRVCVSLGYANRQLITCLQSQRPLMSRVVPFQPRFIIRLKKNKCWLCCSTPGHNPNSHMRVTFHFNPQNPLSVPAVRGCSCTAWTHPQSLSLWLVWLWWTSRLVFGLLSERQKQLLVSSCRTSVQQRLQFSSVFRQRLSLLVSAGRRAAMWPWR